MIATMRYTVCNGTQYSHSREKIFCAEREVEKMYMPD